MAAKLQGQLEPLFQFLTSKSVGDVVTRKEVEQVTGWTGNTFPTHVSKHKFDGFLAKVGKDQFRILRDGSSISKGELSSAFTQVSPERLILTRGIRVAGKHDEYTLRKPLGSGAVGHVWEAEPARGGPRVAVKVMIPREDLLEPKRLDNVRARFRRETSNGLRLNHPRLIKYRDHGELSAHPFLVMDAADESLAQVIARKPLTVSESLGVVVASLEGLAHLHAQGCVHRDIKPHNILAKEKEYLLGDLGIVRWSRHESRVHVGCHADDVVDSTWLLALHGTRAATRSA
ncbi:MAG: protein kinase [Pseudomonadota bacterium]